MCAGGLPDFSAPHIASGQNHAVRRYPEAVPDYRTTPSRSTRAAPSDRLNGPGPEVDNVSVSVAENLAKRLPA